MKKLVSKKWVFTVSLTAKREKMFFFSKGRIYEYTHFYRIREESGSGRPLTVHLRTDDVT